MANFQTHITAGVLTSGVLSTVAMAATVAAPREAVFLTIAGTIGSVLPDIDLASSRQSRTIFGGFGILFAFIALFHYSQFLSVVELSLMWLGMYLFVRYFIWKLFHEFTAHRGLFHSLLASVFFSAGCVIIAYHFLDKTDVIAWLSGLFLFIGTMTHLLLDEIYSIDFAGNRVKRSFGTALKLFDYKKPASAVLMSLALAGVLYFSPPTGDFFKLMRSQDNWAYLQTRLLPKGKWFDIKGLRIELARSRAEAPLITGSTD